METFEIARPSMLPLVIAGVIALTMVGGAVWFLLLLIRVRNVRFEVTDHALQIIAPLYGRTIDKKKLKLDEARVVKLAEDSQLKLVRRTNAIGLPGARIGWFKTAGLGKALVFVARGDTVLYVPTTDGFPLVLETPEAAELLAALKG